MPNLNSILKLASIIIFSISLFTVNAQMPADVKATPETIHLYNNLKKIKGTMIGHQDDLAYGVNWKYEEGRSDVKDVAGDYPAVYGWELGRLENDAAANLDGVPFEKMKQFIRDGYERGGVITISWHLNNPLTGKSAWDPAPVGSVASALPGGEKNELYKSWLDKIAAFMQSLKGKNGELIPVIFRPFHELNGSWFWWGGKNCSPDEIKKLYQFTETYLRDVKNVHNLLYAFNTDRFATKEEYNERYPGDEYVDVLGFDIYQRGADNEKYIAEFDKTLTTLEMIAKEKNKIPALTEFGYGTLPDSTWWTNVFGKVLIEHHMAYALAWRNAGKKSATETEFYVPYTGQPSAENFKKFCDLKQILLEKDVSKMKLYK